MKIRLLLALCLIPMWLACQSVAVTPAKHVQNLKFELQVTRAGCALYLLDTKYPRDPEVTLYCEKLHETP